MTWHNCDGEIGKVLRYASRPHKNFNDGKPTWFLWLASQPLMITHCPICGEKLEKPETACGSGYQMMPTCEGCGNA